MFHFPIISSRDNQKIKFARSVRDGREKNWIFVEGLRLCEEILKTKLQIQNVFVTNNFLQNTRSIEFIETILTLTKEVFVVEDKIFDSLSDTKTSQGIIAIAEKPKTGKLFIEQNFSAVPFLLILHQINNPSNLGAILRTAEAAGIDGIITTKGTNDIFSPKTLRSGMGANLRIPFWINADFYDVLTWAKLNCLKTVCADIRGKNTYFEFDWKLPCLLVFGSEGHGLSSDERMEIEESLVIPMANNVESLNVAVASGIILFEAKRQRNLI